MQLVYMFEFWFGWVVVFVNNGIVIEEVYGIQVYDSEVFGDNFDLKLVVIFERVVLFFRDELVLDFIVSVKLFVGVGIEDVMWKEVVVFKSWDDRYIYFFVFVVNGFDEFVCDKVICMDYSFGILGVFFVVIMLSCIVCLDNEVYVIFDVVVNLVECGVDEGQR